MIFINSHLKRKVDWSSGLFVLLFSLLELFLKDSGPGMKLTSQKTLLIHIVDDDELGPVFEYESCVRFDGYCVRPTYTASSVQTLVRKLFCSNFDTEQS